MTGARRQAAYRRKTARERKHDLIDAGLECLREGGLSSFTIDRICRQAGVSRGLINHHFRSKEDLLVAIYAELTEHLVQIRDAKDSLQLLVDIVETSFDESSFNRANLRAWLSIWAEVANIDALNALHVRRYREYHRRIESALRGVARDACLAIDFDSVARQLIALIDGLWLEYCLHAEGFSLAMAKADCYRLLQAQGIGIDSPAAGTVA